MTMLRIDLRHAPTLWQAFNSDAFVTVVRGPVGSGKSTWAGARIMAQALSQEPAPDGYRYAKWGIVRNTYGELTSTTVSTWRAIFPEATFGPIRYQAPITQHIRRAPSGGQPGLDLRIEFIALDRPKDVRRLLSWEGSGIWFNEVREIEKAIFDAATARVGRYPSRVQGGVECTYPQIIADTNPPDEDHWLYGLELERPDGYAFFAQPGAVLEVGPDTEHLDVRDDQIIRAAMAQFVVNPNAENLPNLPAGYYSRMLAGKDRQWIRVYAEGKYGYVSDGKPVVPEYDDEMMTLDQIPLLPDRQLLIGADIGGGTLAPAAVIGQRHSLGTWLIHAEVVCLDMGLDRFADQIIQTMAELFPGRSLDRGFGDPAGATRDEIFETVAFQHMRSKGVPMYAAPSNSPKARIEAWRRPMTRLINGKPGILIHKRCKMLRAGLAGRWHFRRVQVSGTERYVDTPEKNEYSHPCDAGGYLLMGGGEYRELQGRGGKPMQTVVADTSFTL
jgi:hypothetical protein